MKLSFKKKKYAEEKSVPQMIAFQEQNLYAVALDPVNATKNRYNNVLPRM